MPGRTEFTVDLSKINNLDDADKALADLDVQEEEIRTTISTKVASDIKDQANSLPSPPGLGPPPPLPAKVPKPPLPITADALAAALTKALTEKLTDVVASLVLPAPLLSVSIPGVDPAALIGAAIAGITGAANKAKSDFADIPRKRKNAENLITVRKNILNINNAANAAAAYPPGPAIPVSNVGGIEVFTS